MKKLLISGILILIFCISGYAGGSCPVEWTSNIGPAYSVDICSSCIVDFDNDGTNELLIGTRAGASSTVDILKYNNASKTWNLIDQINLPNDVSYVDGVHAADMDNDGDLDIVTGIRFRGIYAYENLGSYNWREQRIELDEQYGWFGIMVDIDGDGNMDVLHGGDWLGLGIQYGDGNWGFTKGESPFGPDPLPAPQNAHFVNVLRTNDINNDGKPDILIFGGTRPNAYYPVEQSMYIYLNLGSRQWSSNISPIVPSNPPAHVYFDTGDFNNDNNEDFVIGNRGTNFGGGLAVFFGDGTGNWNEVSAPNLSSSQIPFPSVFDLNNDGYDDIITTDFGGPLGCYVFINNKDNTWSEGQSQSPNTQDDFWLLNTFGDLNNDSLVDMVAYLTFGTLAGVHVWFQKEVSCSNTAPAISMLEPDGIDDNADATYAVTWNDSDPDDDAQISLYYNTIPTNMGGTLITSGLSEDAGGANGSYLWDTSGIAEGSYYVYAKIDDLVNSPVYSYSSGQVTITHAVARPEPPLQLKATAGRDVVNMVWQLSTSLDVEKYKIYRSLLSDFNISPDKLIGQVTGDKNTYHDRGLTEDTVYYYRVTAVSTSTLESEPSNEAWGRPGRKQHNLLLHKNKFNPNKGEKVEVKYTVEETSTVKIKIFNIKGKLVYEFPEQTLFAGEYEIQWDGISKNAKVVSSGVYVIQLFFDGKLKDTKKTLIVK